ncbi:hydrophobin family protein [Streptomyces sp. NPDC049577]|uniref:hydrophobin family protein n=1 Tax=Streptomyces sp. NPDC049577 TaxID=3155153 RepID=UPI003443E268
MPVKTTVRQLSTAVATAALIVAASLAGTGTAQAAGRTPMRCRTVGSPDDPAIASALRVLGVAHRNLDAPVGLSCTPMPNGDRRVNFCAPKNTLNTIAAVGQRPRGHVCP